MKIPYTNKIVHKKKGKVSFIIKVTEALNMKIYKIF